MIAKTVVQEFEIALRQAAFQQCPWGFKNGQCCIKIVQLSV